MSELGAIYKACQKEVRKVIIGQDELIDGALIALLTDGHVLLEGPPGLAKTLLVRTLSAALSCRFSRVQFTPDLMPSDVTGSTILKDGELIFRPGPVFTHLLLGDEINRAPAKTQSALLEAMQERAVTADGVRHALEQMFIVFATQNPIEQEGTYPLPEAQLDRFMMKLLVDYPAQAEEERILAQHHQGAGRSLEQVKPVVLLEQLQAMKAHVQKIEVSEQMISYAVQLIRATRTHLSVAVGVSPRAGLALLAAAKGQAAITERGYIIPDDIKRWS